MKINSIHPFDNMHLQEFPEYLKNKYIRKIKDGELVKMLYYDIEHYCTMLYRKGKINEEFKSELITFFQSQIKLI